MTMDSQLAAQIGNFAAWHEIHAAVCDYIRGQDRLQPEIHRSAFHDDAYVDIGLFAGSRDAFIDYAQGLLGEMAACHHQLGQIDIRINGDVATGEIYFTAWHRISENGMPRDLIVAGRYIDQYEKREGKWKIAKRRELMDWSRNDPATDDFMRTPTIHLGIRGPDDFSLARDWPGSIDK